MSFLLDALRKSERIAARRAVPTIHSSEPDPEPVLGRPGAGWRWLLLLPVVVAGGWLLAQRYGAVPAGVKPLGYSTEVVRTESPDPGRTADEGLTAAKEREARPADQASASPGARTPVEMIGPVSPGDRQGAEVGVEPDEGAGAAEAAPVQAVMAEDGGLLASAESPVVSSPPVVDGSEFISTPAAARAPAAARQNYIDYRQLPDQVRDQLPAFNMTVLVYAEQPSDRFILMNGGRQQEGDEPQPGLKLLEIRREGAVYLFQQYRFLVSR